MIELMLSVFGSSGCCCCAFIALIIAVVALMPLFRKKETEEPSPVEEVPSARATLAPSRGPLPRSEVALQEEDFGLPPDDEELAQGGPAVVVQVGDHMATRDTLPEGGVRVRLRGATVVAAPRADDAEED